VVLQDLGRLILQGEQRNQPTIEVFFVSGRLTIMTAGMDRTSGHYDKELETLSVEERAAYQNAELQRIVQHACANAPAVNKKFEDSLTKPDDIKTVKDLERLPITHKHELAELQQSEPPFGGFLGVPMDQLKRICMSPGPIYEPEEIHSQNDRWTQAFFAAGFRKGDIGQITFSYHLVPPAFWFEDALHRLGCIATPGPKFSGCHLEKGPRGRVRPTTRSQSGSRVCGRRDAPRVPP
jgi:phenylacetate-coenzyme A ligase PaaK-like adenylate-forming protein